MTRRKKSPLDLFLVTKFEKGVSFYPHSWLTLQRNCSYITGTYITHTCIIPIQVNARCYISRLKLYRTYMVRYMNQKKNERDKKKKKYEARVPLLSNYYSSRSKVSFLHLFYSRISFFPGSRSLHIIQSYPWLVHIRIFYCI